MVTDSAVRAAFERIADDEQRHAELAWRALAWMLDGADDATRAEVHAAFRQAAAAADAITPADPSAIARTAGFAGRPRAGRHPPPGSPRGGAPPAHRRSSRPDAAFVLHT